MKVLYFTNEDIQDWEVIPGIIKRQGDTVMTHTSRIDLDFIKNNNIEFIVSDRARYLIKKDVIDYLPRKIVNLHPSFLPWNRGYHPNYWAIKEGTPYGVTLHFIDEGIDTGAIIAQTRAFYSNEDTLRTTYDRLRNLMVSLFAACWLEVRLGKMAESFQNKDDGTLHYKRDFNEILESLPDGWDTKIEFIKRSKKL